MARIRIEMDVDDDLLDENTGELTVQAWNDLLDAIVPIGDNIDIEEL